MVRSLENRVNISVWDGAVPAMYGYEDSMTRGIPKTVETKSGVTSKLIFRTLTEKEPSSFMSWMFE